MCTEKCPKVKVLEELKERQEKEEADRKEKEERQAKENDQREAEEKMMTPFVTKANFVKGELKKIVLSNITEVAENIRAVTGLPRFVIGGSYASLKIFDACAELQENKTDFAVEVVPLVSNDIDVFHGDFTDDSSKDLFVDKCSIQKFNVDGVELEVNTIKCNNLSPETFLANNGVNITASCIDIDFESGNMTASIFASSCFWTFLFQDHFERKVQAVNTINGDVCGANTCVRIAYKAFQMEEFEIQFTLGNIDFTQGTIAVSGKDKFDQMKNWSSSSFHEYQCNKVENHFVIAKQHKKVNCASEGCDKWANKNCGHEMCKKCCMKLQRKSMKSSACSAAAHRLPKTGLDVTDGDNAVTGE